MCLTCDCEKRHVAYIWLTWEWEGTLGMHAPGSWHCPARQCEAKVKRLPGMLKRFECMHAHPQGLSPGAVAFVCRFWRLANVWPILARQVSR
jgi:hypothetical protein